MFQNYYLNKYSVKFNGYGGKLPPAPMNTYTRLRRFIVTTNPATDAGNDNPSYPPITSVVDGTLSTCDALLQCANLAVNDPDSYWSFDLHYKKSTAQWICIQYFDPGQTAADFTVTDTDIGAAYGYGSVNN